MIIFLTVIVLSVSLSEQVYNQDIFATQDIFSTQLEKCNIDENAVQDYQYTMYEFAAQTYKNVGAPAMKIDHIIFSPLSAWIIFSAIAEGADPVTKEIMFELLRLPRDPCTRLKFYQIATSRYVSRDDAHVSNTRTLVIDDGVSINSTYNNFVSQNTLLNIITAPLKNDPQAALAQIKKLTSAAVPKLNLSGNSIILDVTDCNALWNDAFEDAIVEKAPFYSLTGEQIGSVDLMKIKRRAKMTYNEKFNFIGLELPVGQEGRYRMIFGLIIDPHAWKSINNITKEDIYDFLHDFHETPTPIDIAIPRIQLTSEFDVRQMLEDLGVKSIWSNPKITGYISEPAALPSGYIQRASISLGNANTQARTSVVEQPPPNSSSKLDPRLGQEFIANKPFYFALLDMETGIYVMTGAFTEPTYID